MTAKKPHQVTIVDVARESGVSHATVSRVLNKSGYIKDSTRDRVLAAVEKLGYVVNQQARSLAGGNSRLIGLVIADFLGSYMGDIARAIEAELLANDYDIAIFPTRADPKRERDQIERNMTGLVDGLIVTLVSPPEEYLDMLSQRGVPYVLIGSERANSTQTIVGYTNWQGGYDATQHLIELGHRRIAFLCGPKGRVTAEARYQAYCDALRDAAIGYDTSLVVRANFSQDQAYAVTKPLLELADPPTALFAANDRSAIGAINAAKDIGLSVPEDFSIVGFDGVREASIVSPALTTVQVPMQQLGRQSVNMLIALMDNPDTPARTVTLGTQLIIRDSTAPPRDF